MQNQFFIDYLERLENLRKGFAAELQELPAEALDWVPGPEMNSAAVLLAHTAGSLRYWIGDVALGDPSGRDRAAEFETRGFAGPELLGRVDAVLEYARSALTRLRLEDLQAERILRDGAPVTCGWALLHAMEHAYLHLGHIQLTAQMWRGRGI